MQLSYVKKIIEKEESKIHVNGFQVAAHPGPGEITEWEEGGEEGTVHVDCM